MIVGLSLLKIINKVIHLAIPIIVHILSFIMTLCILSNRIPVRQKSIFERKLTFKFTHDISYKDYLDTLSNKHSLDIELKIYKTRGLASWLPDMINRKLRKGLNHSKYKQIVKSYQTSHSETFIMIYQQMSWEAKWESDITKTLRDRLIY